MECVLKANQWFLLARSLICSALISCVLTNASFALPSNLTSCREEIIISYTNLQKAAFPEKFSITSQLETLLNSKEVDAYSVSMPLLVSAQLGNNQQYIKSTVLMSKAIDSMNDDPFKAWIYGRIIFAAHSMKDPYTEASTKRKLDILLEKLLKDDTTCLDRFKNWSLGYIAALNKEEFVKAKEPMISGANHLSDTYVKVNASDVSKEKKQEVRSDALWAWVMITQAAANAQDKEVYENAITQILSITKQSSLSNALSKGLLRTAASNDYPAWAIGIVRLAAQTIGDNDRFEELGATLENSIAEAKEGSKIQEFLLASVNGQLAIARSHEMEQCQTPSMK